jgi:hypothetical protein
MPSKKTQKKSGRSPSNKKASSQPTCTYRVLGYQPLSVDIDPQTFDGLSIQKTPCRISIRSAQLNTALQLQAGGSILAIEFESAATGDLIATARRGLSLLEDFLSALALVAGSTFQTTEPIQVARLSADNGGECEFIIFKRLPMKHWAKPITQETVASAKHLLAHWDGLDMGHRLRRAALQYREAIGNLDDTSAFQEAYIGLESMEPPLAKAAGLQPGTEGVRGSCQSCGHEFTRKKTSLVGLRAFVLDDLDPDSADEDRKADWKLINTLRNDLMHGLIDPEKLADRPHRALLAAMHYLHASICVLSHASDLTGERYLLARGGSFYLFWGTYKALSWPALHEWGPVIEVADFAWVPHKQYGFVPQVDFKNDGLQDLQMGFATLGEPLSFASMNSIRAVRSERD